MVPATPIARNGAARDLWLTPSDCQAVSSLSDDERLQTITVPKSKERGSVMTAMPGMRLSSNLREISAEDSKDSIRLENLLSCRAKTSVVRMRKSMQTRGIISLMACQNILHFIYLPINNVSLLTGGRPAPGI